MCDCTVFRQVERIRAYAESLVAAGFIGEEDRSHVTEHLIRFAYGRGLLETYKGLVSSGEYPIEARRAILDDYVAWIEEAPRTSLERRAWIEGRGISTARINKWAERLGYKLRGSSSIGEQILDAMRSDPSRGWSCGDIIDATGSDRNRVSSALSDLRRKGKIRALNSSRPMRYEIA